MKSMSYVVCSVLMVLTSSLAEHALPAALSSAYGSVDAASHS